MNWDLSRLYPSFDDPALARDIARAQTLADELDALTDGAHASAGDEAALLCQAVEGLSALTLTASRIQNIVMLTLAANADDEGALKHYDISLKLQTRIKRITSALKRYLGGVTDITSVIASDPVLMANEAWILRQRALSAHAMDPAIEDTALKFQLSGGYQWSKLRNDLIAAHTVTLNGKELTLSEARNLASSPDAEVRRAAFEAEMASYPALETPMAACLSAIKGEAQTMAELKHYDSVLDEALDLARVSRPVLNAMLIAMREALPIFRRFLHAKARALGYDGGLKYYDIGAPLGSANHVYTLSEARALLKRTLGSFHPRMGEMVDRAFDENWIDAFPRPGKEGGAFCQGVMPLGTSYILTNFDGSYRSVNTLAHELGHAWHDQQLFKNNVLSADAPMTLAETASTFNEVLLTHALLEDADDDARLALLNQELTEATAIIVDILSRFEFESNVVAARAERSLSAKDFCAMMEDAQIMAYGDGLDQATLHRYAWANKPHYYDPNEHFYNYPYAFGLLFGTGIFQHFYPQGEAGAEQYDELLRQAGLGDAAAVARSVDIDLTDPDFWRASLKHFEASLARFEALVDTQKKPR